MSGIAGFPTKHEDDEERAQGEAGEGTWVSGETYTLWKCKECGWENHESGHEDGKACHCGNPSCSVYARVLIR